MKVVWNISAECVSTIILCIIWVYSRKGNPLPSLKNKLFQICFLTTFCSMTFNILSTLMIGAYQNVPIWLIWTITTLYFIATPLMGAAYFFYAISIIYEHQNGVNRILRWASIPAYVYFGIILINPITKDIFDCSRENGYVQGPYVLLTYIVFYLYCVGCMVAVLLNFKNTERSIRRILSAFALIATVVIIVQQMFPQYILTGSAATCALLIIYLYLQNKQISIDYLTGIPNRQEFLNLLEMKVQAQQPFFIVVVSLKNFKTVNDKFGQQNGDLFLLKVRDYLMDVTAPYRMFRFSGDEFAIIMDSNDKERVDAMTGKICARFVQPWATKNYTSILHSAIAIVKYPSSADSLEGLVNGIEAAVAHAKQDTVRNCCYCTAEMLGEVKRKQQILEILRERVESDTLEVYYQPILSVAQQKFLMAESLLRLKNTPLGEIYPSEFIPIAEDSGLIVQMTYQVLERVCKLNKKLMDDGLEIEGISINFASAQFLEEDISGKVLRVIERNQIPYSKIKIEITETVLMDNYKGVKNFVEEMHQKGILFCMDDFGTGYSNIATLINFAIDTVKMDKSLVWSSVKSHKAAALMSHLVAAFCEQGMRVLAEGVENEEQRLFIEGCGCDMIQGFLYAKPMPAEEAETYLGRQAEHVRLQFTV